MSASEISPEVAFDKFNPAKICSLLGFPEEHYKMIKDNKDIVELLQTGCGNAFKKNPMSGTIHEFRSQLFMEMADLCYAGAATLAKRQLFGCLMDAIKEDSKLYSGGKKKLAEFALADFESCSFKARDSNKTDIRTHRQTLNFSDPWVNYENKKYRYSRFMMLKRNKCYVVKMPESDEYLAMDAEKLQNGFDKMKIPLKVKDLPNIDENDERIPPNCRGKEPTELEGLVFKTMCELIIENGEKMKEEEKKALELAQAKLEKKKELNRKTRERKKAAKKANKDQKAEELDEKEDFKLEAVNEEEV